MCRFKLYQRRNSFKTIFKKLEKLFATNSTILGIKNKTQASISNNGFYINHIVILDTPFIDMISPYKTSHESITSKFNGSKLVFPFLEKLKL